MNRIFMIRHGQPGRETPLSEHGELQAQGAAEELVRVHGVEGGESTTVLSSNVPRALRTAEIIGEEIGSLVLPSVAIARIGFSSSLVGSLDEHLSGALDEAEHDADGLNDLVVVAHEPIVASVASLATEDEMHFVGHCEIFEYEPGTWRNPDSSSY